MTDSSKIHQHSKGSLPLEVQDAIDSSRNFSVFFAAAYSVLFLYLFFVLLTDSGDQSTGSYIVIWGILVFLYSLAAMKLSKKTPPVESGWAVTTAIMTVFTAVSIVGIFIDIQLWRNVIRIRKFMKHGSGALLSDKEWLKKHKKSTWSDTRQVVTAIIGATILTMVIIGFSLLGQSGNQSVDQSLTPTELASRTVEDVKLESTFPMQTDNEFVIVTDITSEGTNVQYRNQIKGADTSSISESSLFEGVKPSLCANTTLRQLLNAGVNVQYIYTIYESQQQYTITFTGTSCA